MKPSQIVLIEDNPADVLLVKVALEESGIEHAVTKFDNGAQAVQTLCVPDGPDRLIPDAILLDLNTPRTDGFETIRRLRESFAGVPITILTSSRARSDKQQAAQLGVNYLEKASELQEFLTSVGSAVKEMLKGPAR